MRGFGAVVHAVDLLELGDPVDRLLGERRLPIERVEHDPFQLISQRQVVAIGERVEHFDQTLLHAASGLDPLDLDLLRHWLLGTLVTQYLGVKLTVTGRWSEPRWSPIVRELRDRPTPSNA